MTIVRFGMTGKAVLAQKLVVQEKKLSLVIASNRISKLTVNFVEKNIQPWTRKTKKLNPVSKKHFVNLIHGVHGPVAQKHVVAGREPEIETVRRIHVVENHRRLNFVILKCVCHNGVIGNRLANALVLVVRDNFIIFVLVLVCARAEILIKSKNVTWSIALNGQATALIVPVAVIKSTLGVAKKSMTMEDI